MEADSDYSRFEEEKEQEQIERYVQTLMDVLEKRIEKGSALQGEPPEIVLPNEGRRRIVPMLRVIDIAIWCTLAYIYANWCGFSVSFGCVLFGTMLFVMFDKIRFAYRGGILAGILERTCTTKTKQSNGGIPQLRR